MHLLHDLLVAVELVEEVEEKQGLSYVVTNYDDCYDIVLGYHFFDFLVVIVDHETLNVDHVIVDLVVFHG